MTNCEGTEANVICMANDCRDPKKGRRFFGKGSSDFPAFHNVNFCVNNSIKIVNS